MKNTGIVRRIDNLGRVVIPKELRRTMNLKEGDPMAISVDGDMICLSLYDPTPSLESSINRIKTAADELPATSLRARKIVDKIAELEEIIRESEK